MMKKVQITQYIENILYLKINLLILLWKYNLIILCL